MVWGLFVVQSGLFGFWENEDWLKTGLDWSFKHYRFLPSQILMSTLRLGSRPM
jgi:hypothetical protein